MPLLPRYSPDAANATAWSMACSEANATWPASFGVILVEVEFIRTEISRRSLRRTRASHRAMAWSGVFLFFMFCFPFWT